MSLERLQVIRKRMDELMEEFDEILEQMDNPKVYVLESDHIRVNKVDREDELNELLGIKKNQS